MRKNCIRALLAAAALAAASLSGAPAPAQSLPGNASSLRESYADWLVTCIVRDARPACAMAQTQADPQTRKRVLLLELQVDSNKEIAGALLMPFGLALGEGVSLAIDERQEASHLPFSTCLPGGCVVPLAIDAALASALGAGATLNVEAAANDSGQRLTFAVSLDGFSAALARLRELSV